jgi:hypothetical protein
MTDLTLCAICGETVIASGVEPAISRPDGTFVHRSCQEALEREPNAESFF